MNKRGKKSNEWFGEDIIAIDPLSVEGVNQMLEYAAAFQAGKIPKQTQLGIGKVIALAFMEPSTRTSCSFAAAAQRMGCGVIYTNSTESSVKKGETLSDTMKCLASYADAIVIRHPQPGSAKIAADAVSVPVLNAGDGTGEHPTQALLDLYTITRHFTSNADINVTFLGDAKNGRTIHSLVKLLAKMWPNRVHARFVTPEELQMPAEYMNLPGLLAESCPEMTDDILAQTNVLYVTRVQKERFATAEAYELAMKKSFIVTSQVMSKLNKHAIVMHPLPRVDEISVEVDDDARAIYFEQMENGMYVRMALLGMVLNIL